ncbi:rho-related protein racA-like [Pecten maximus]|uniref:rho-related protein racA-like n=1 Tax=Pecten maximus TaxID=6579 RepID=UPI0014589F48|nr:rho-related protein racA-like [Pecten maximus]
MTKIKLVAVGDQVVGKTCLFISYTSNILPEENIPALFDTYVTAVLVGGIWIDVELNDTHGFDGEDYRYHLRSLCDADVVLICFSVENRESFANVRGKWIEFLRRICTFTPFVLVACQIDLRYKSVSDVVTYEEGLRLANDLRIPYIETSAITQQGLRDVVDTAVREALNSEPPKTRTVHHMFCCCRKKLIPIAPLVPPVDKAPLIKVEPSRYAKDWMTMLENPVHADVTFVLDGQQNLDAHKLVLCSASTYFRRMFEKTMKMTESMSNCTTHDLNSEHVEGVKAIKEKDMDKDAVVGQGHRHTVVELRSDVKPNAFVKVLEFLYSGMANLTNDHNQIDPHDIADVVRLSELFQLPRLAEICQNCLNEQEILNPSIGTYLIEETGRKMKELYFNKPETADVAFIVEGGPAYAHKSVLSARCEIMAAMFGGQFAEGRSTVSEVNIPDTSAECFMTLLEYLYTDYAQIEEVNVMELLVVADKYGLKRLLSLCEVFVTNEMNKRVKNSQEKADMDVLGLLHTSQNYNAEQLSSWCLHFISANYTSFKNRKELSSLKEENKTYIEENQWPPLSYLREVEEYERDFKSDCYSKCAIL